MNLEQNPSGTTGPFYFMEEEGAIQGAVHSLLTILYRFEPIDVLNGKAIIFDSDGRKITFLTKKLDIIQRNEYPKNYEGIYYDVGEVDYDFVLRLAHLKETGAMPEFLD